MCWHLLFALQDNGEFHQDVLEIPGSSRNGESVTSCMRVLDKLAPSVRATLTYTLIAISYAPLAALLKSAVEHRCHL